MHVYIGSRTTRERNARGDGISVFDYAPDTGALTATQVVGGLVNPSYLLPHPSLPVLYAVHGDRREVSTLRRDPRSGRLEPWRSQSCEGQNPVHLALAPSGRYLMVSNHLSGTLAVLPVAADGSLEPVAQQIPMAGEPGPHRKEQPHAKPHYNLVDPSGRYVIVPDKGLDRVFLHALQDGRVDDAPAGIADAREGAGPRHAAFHPAGRWAYVINELDNTVTAYAVDAGALRPFQVLPSLPDTCTGNSRAAGIAIDAGGRRLYASNRGDDSIAVFQIDPRTGRLAAVQHAATHGRTPRFFTLAPGGRFLFVLNEDSDTLERFRVHPEDGTLAHDGGTQKIGSPVCMVFAPRLA